MLVSQAGQSWQRERKRPGSWIGLRTGWIEWIRLDREKYPLTAPCFLPCDFDFSTFTSLWSELKVTHSVCDVLVRTSQNWCCIILSHWLSDWTINSKLKGLTNSESCDMTEIVKCKFGLICSERTVICAIFIVTSGRTFESRCHRKQNCTKLVSSLTQESSGVLQPEEHGANGRIWVCKHSKTETWSSVLQAHIYHCCTTTRSHTVRCSFLRCELSSEILYGMNSGFNHIVKWLHLPLTNPVTYSSDPFSHQLPKAKKLISPHIPARLHY